MAVTDVKLTRLRGSARPGKPGSTLAGYTAEFQVLCDNPEDTPKTVYKHFEGNADLPWWGRKFKLGDPGGFDPFAICTGLDAATIDSSGGMYTAVAQYEPQSGQGLSPPSGDVQTGTGGQQSLNPLDWYDDIEVIFTQISVPVERATFRGFINAGDNPHFPKDKFLPVMGSNRKPLIPGIEVEFDIKIIRLTRYVNEYDDTFFNKMQGTVNSQKVVINKPLYRFATQIEPLFGRMRVGGTFARINEINCWRRTIELQVNPFGWRRNVLDQGVDELYVPGDKDKEGNTLSASDFPEERPWEHREITDSEGYVSVTPVLLDGKGKTLAPTKDPVYLSYSVYDEVPWVGINW